MSTILITVSTPGDNENVKSAFSDQMKLFHETYRSTVGDFEELKTLIESQVQNAPNGQLVIFDLQLPYDIVRATIQWVHDFRIPVVLHYVPLPIGYL